MKITNTWLFGPGQDPNTLNNFGCTFTFVVSTTAATIKLITGAADYLLGQTIIGPSAGGAASMFAANGTTIRSLNLNGTTTGGIVGSYFNVMPISANTYWVWGNLIGSGSLATPFATS